MSNAEIIETSLKVANLVGMYNSGAITGHQLMLDCLDLIQPSQPQFVLNKLPEDIIDEMLEYTKRYTTTMLTATPGSYIKAPEGIRDPSLIKENVEAAKRWIIDHKITKLKSELSQFFPSGRYMDTWLDTPNKAFENRCPRQFFAMGEFKPIESMIYFLESGQPS